MKFTRIIVLGIALVAGVVAAYLALNLTAPETIVQHAEPQTVRSVEVLVASQDIRIGTSMSSGLLEWREWPETGLSDRLILRSQNPDALETVSDSLARVSLFEGEPISDGKLINSDSGFLSAILPAGKLAVATRIAADTSAGGFILPNDHVDVIMTRLDEKSANDGNSYITETILRNVRILAIDQTIEEQDGEQVVVGQTATLELAPRQAEILTVAQQISDRLTLALRSIADSSEPTNPMDDAVHLIGGSGGAVTLVKSGIVSSVDGLR
jgi:pilus assembly protein CpaB